MRPQSTRAIFTSIGQVKFNPGTSTDGRAANKEVKGEEPKAGRATGKQRRNPGRGEELNGTSKGSAAQVAWWNQQWPRRGRAMGQGKVSAT